MNTKLITTLGAIMMLAGIVNGFAGDDSFSIAREKDIAGKRVSGACLPFAQDLYSRMTEAGGETHLVIFDWKSGTGHGTHAIVVYRDSEGRYWGMDNLQNKPVWLAGDNAQAWAEFFAPRFEVTVRAHKTDPALAGHYADRAQMVARHNSNQSSDQMLAAK